MYDELASQAQTSANTFKNSLQYLIDAANQQKLQEQQTTSQRYTNLVNQINQQREPLTTQYGQNAEAAYVNKMMSAQSVNENLNRLGLNATGFGVGQRLQTETDYGQRLGDLTGAYNQNIRTLENQITNTRGEEITALNALDTTYSGKLADINKYITESTQDYYKQTFADLLNSRKYQEELKQQELDNQFREKQLTEQKRATNLSYSSSGGGGFTTGPSVTPEEAKAVTANYTPTAVVRWYKALGLDLPGLSDTAQVFTYKGTDNTPRFVVYSEEDNAMVDITSRVKTLSGLSSAEVNKRLIQYGQANNPTTSNTSTTNKSKVNVSKSTLPTTNKSTVNVNKSVYTPGKTTSSKLYGIK